MNGIEMIAELMAVSAMTAPKSKGENFVRTKVLQGNDLKKIAQSMSDYEADTGKKDFSRDSRNIAACDALLLIGVKNATTIGLNCQACGHEDCKSLRQQKSSDGEFKGPMCAFRLLDMGIALGSAVKTASIHNIDNRIMYRAGVIARKMGLVDWDFVMGIPLSVSGKNIFFDR